MATLYERAVALALRAHATQVRKIDNSPYIVHPLCVAHLLTEHGASEEVVAAAILHDVLEDTTVTAAEIKNACGAEVLRIVQAVTEPQGLPWEERKAAYLLSVKAGGESAWLVSIADKIHNAQSVLDAIAKDGDVVWEAFTRGKATKLAVERQLHRELSLVWSHPLITHYNELILHMEGSY